ncbi:MAG: SGNH/GDSL hydrolase family protein [Bacteroidota bacterium]
MATKLILIVGLLIAKAAFSQDGADRDKIAASQTGASPIYFETLNMSIPAVERGNYNNEQECSVRGGLPRFLTKVNSGKEVVVAFIGGSITQSNFGYRLQTAKYMEQTYAQAKFKWINAGVSGTGTELGAFRIQEQVLNHRPDLIFIEFAVNGAYPDGMEGMIRQAIKRNPDVEICLIYTILNGQSAIYQKNELPLNIVGLERVAAYYDLPAVNLGMEASSLEAAEKLIWKGNSQTANPHQILFSEDGIHPSTVGGNLYASAIARALKKMESVKQPKKSQLPKPLITANWDDATMVDAAMLENKDWQLIATADHPNLKKFSPWFSAVLTANKPGASFSFRFKGDMVGVFDIGGPEVGQLEWTIDGKPVKLNKEKQGSFSYYQTSDAAMADPLNRFNAYCNNRYRGQFDVIKVPEGEHLVTVTLSAQQANKLAILPEDQRSDIVSNPKKYDQTVIYLGRILLRGNIIK